MTIPEHISPETRLLLACALPPGAQSDAAHIDTLRAAAATSIDWTVFLEHTSRHRLTSNVFAWLAFLDNTGTGPESLPPTILGELHQRHLTIAARNFVKIQHLYDMHEQLQKHDIQATCIKGPALALQAYGNIAVRPFADIDLVVHRTDLLRVHDVFAENGYKRAKPPANVDLNAYRRTSQEWVFVSLAKHAVFDVKCVPVSHTIARTAFGEWVLASSTGITDGAGGTITAPSPEATLLVSCVHAVHELWPDLRALSDIAGVMSRRPNLQWTDLMQTAEGLGHKRALLIGTHLARQLLGVPLPEQLNAAFEQDQKIGKLTREARDCILCSPAGKRPDWPAQRYELRACDSFGDALRCAVRQMFVPGAADVTAFPRMKRLFPVLYLLRPLRRILRLLRSG